MYTMASLTQLSQVTALHNTLTSISQRPATTSCVATSSSFLYTEPHLTTPTLKQSVQSSGCTCGSTARTSRRRSGIVTSSFSLQSNVREWGPCNIVRDVKSSLSQRSEKEARAAPPLVKFVASFESGIPSIKETNKNDLSWNVLKESTLRRAAGLLVGSALLVTSLGLGLARPALARTAPPPAAETSSTQQNESELESNQEAIRPESTEEATASQSASDPKNDPAELVLLTFLERHPEDLKALEGLMYVRLRKGDVTKALEVIDKLLAVRPDHAPWQLVRAQSLEFVGDLDQARRAFEAILDKDPLSARALQGLATVMSKAGEAKEMLEMLQRAVQTALESGKPKEAKNLRMLLGQMHTLQGNFQEALQQYQDVAKEDPRDFRPYLCQGLVYSLLDKKLEAESAFRKYRRLCPKTFPERGYLDDLMIGAKAEARKLHERERLKPAKGKKAPKPLRQPFLDTAVAQEVEK